jgi:hypothetical protein
VRQKIVEVLLEIKSGDAVKGHISTNLRTRDHSQGKTSTTQHSTATSGSSDSDSEDSDITLDKSTHNDLDDKERPTNRRNSEDFDTLPGNIAYSNLDDKKRPTDHSKRIKYVKLRAHSKGTQCPTATNAPIQSDSEDFHTLPENSKDS